MKQEAGKRIGEVRIKKFIEKSNRTLLRLEKATVRPCTLPEEEAKSRFCTELGNPEGRECEELVLIYRPFGCIREKNAVDLNEETVVTSETKVRASPSLYRAQTGKT
jgi:hypothetical protein